MARLQLQHVTRRFDNGQEGLSDVSLSIEPGSMVFLTGHSGAGKKHPAENVDWCRNANHWKSAGGWQ